MKNALREAPCAITQHHSIGYAATGCRRRSPAMSVEARAMTLQIPLAQDAQSALDCPGLGRSRGYVDQGRVKAPAHAEKGSILILNSPH